MRTIHLSRLSPELQILKERTFPDYSGHMFRLQVAEKVCLDNLNWDGGSRSQYRAVTLGGLDVGSADKFNALAPWVNPAEGVELEIPVGMCCVKHDYFCGKNRGLTFIVHPNAMNKLLLPECPQLTREEKIVLYFTRSVKSSYAGISNYRFHEATRRTNIDLATWENTQNNLISKEFLAKNKSITAAGKNVLGNMLSWSENKEAEKA